jgi:hypothetical protein
VTLALILGYWFFTQPPQDHQWTTFLVFILAWLALLLSRISSELRSLRELHELFIDRVEKGGAR